MGEGESDGGEAGKVSYCAVLEVCPADFDGELIQDRRGISLSVEQAGEYSLRGTFYFFLHKISPLIV